MAETSAVVIGASGGIGAAVVRALAASGGYEQIHALSRSTTGLDLTEEASVAEAARAVGEGPPPSLIFVATGVLHHGQEPERT